ncbi:hypothetical protein [Opitutus sp. ER46]|uniref:hypothetical protein n=1 Tax=Opitutus sp. ER46 TaxID=2161864 RepID=UPI000D318C19|nr:hypothetical protein [Opitutus sp. ER46]PTX90634.1 hypothetical protein DB354_18350 [Opitutus sp. ER46]
MSWESHQRYLERQALRAAQKAIDRGALTAERRADASRLRIQTVEPWKRALLALASVALGITAYLTLDALPVAVSGGLFVGSGLLLAFAALGIRRTAEAVLDSVDLVSLLDALF